MKKILILGLFIGGIFSVNNQAFAEEEDPFYAPGYQRIDYFSGALHTYSWEGTPTYNSGGGKFKVCLSYVNPDPPNSYTIQLYEMDPGKATYHNEVQVGGNGCAIFDVEDLKDGDNNKAELFANYGYSRWDDSFVRVSVYD